MNFIELKNNKTEFKTGTFNTNPFYWQALMPDKIKVDFNIRFIIDLYIYLFARSLDFLICFVGGGFNCLYDIQNKHKHILYIKLILTTC